MLYEETLNLIKQNKYIKEKGEKNYITSPRFGAFAKYYPGIIKGHHVCITANSGVGKTQFTKFYTILNTLQFIRKNPNYQVKIIYFALEEAKELFMVSIMCYILEQECGIKINSNTLLSFSEDTVDDSIIDCLKDHSKYFNLLERIVTVIDDMFDVDDIISYLSNIEYKSDVHYIVVMDHISLLEGSILHSDMSKYSKFMLKRLCNRGVTSIVIHQQAADQEGVNNLKFNRTEPSKNGLGDNKLLGRDYTSILGLYDPLEFNLNTHNGIDLLNFKESNPDQQYRSLSVIKNRYGLSNIRVPLMYNGNLNFAYIKRN